MEISRYVDIKLVFAHLLPVPGGQMRIYRCDPHLSPSTLNTEHYSDDQVTLENYLDQLGHRHRGPDEGPGDEPLVEDVLDPGLERDGDGVEEGVPAQDSQSVAVQRRDLQVQQLVLPVMRFQLKFRGL